MEMNTAEIEYHETEDGRVLAYYWTTFDQLSDRDEVVMFGPNGARIFQVVDIEHGRYSIRYRYAHEGDLPGKWDTDPTQPVKVLLIAHGPGCVGSGKPCNC